MYQFHSWIVIRNQTLENQHEQQKITSTERDAKFNTLINQLKDKLNEKPGGLVEDTYHFTRSNGMTTLHFSGLWNHEGPNATLILEWIRINAPYSYGLLYVQNEQSDEDSENFIVYRLAKNKITKLTDTFLSPFLKEVDEGYYED